MDDLIAFQSSSFPASRAGDPESSELEAAGVECLTVILAAIRGDAITLKVPPSAEGSGCSAIVVLRGTDIVVHLTWFPAGSRGAQHRDLWTLQAGPSGWLCRLLPSGRRRSDEAGHDVMAIVERALRARPAEFTEVRRCTWRDLER